MSETSVPSRKPLRDMTPSERADWYLEQRAELEDFCSYAQSYMKRRKRRGIETGNDNRYEHFFTRAADLLAGLDELRQEAMEQAEKEDTQ